MKSSNSNRLRTSVATLLGVAYLSAPPVQAQSSGETLEMVTVTARKQEESLQQVPLTITAFSSEALEKVAPASLYDITILAPGVNYQSGTGRGGQGRLQMRGLSAGTSGSAKASLFLDGIYISGNASNVALNNLERIEVLSGPQSAQYGRSTFAGAINYITRDPTSEFEGRIAASGANLGEREANIWLGGPLLGDRLLGSLEVYHQEYRGDDKWVASDGKTPLGKYESQSVGGKLIFKATDDLEFELRGTYYEDEDYPVALYYLDPFLRNTAFTRPNGTTTFFPTGTLEPSLFTGDYTHVPYINPLATDITDNRDGYRTALTMNWDIGDWALTAIGGYQKEDTARGQSGSVQAPYSLYLLQDNPNYGLSTGDSEVDDTSFELRLTSPQEQRLRYSIGVFYEEVNSANTGITYGMNTCLTTCTLNVLGQYRVNTRITLADAGSTVEDKSIFGAVFYDINDWITASLEARYQKEYRRSYNRISGLDIDNTFNAFVPRFNMQFRASDDLQFYVTYSVGNNPGTFNTSQFLGLPGTNTYESQRYVKEESLYNYEIGMKSMWLDGRLMFNAAAYHMNWVDLQSSATYFAPDGAGFFGVIENRGSAEIDGVQMELTAIPADGWNIRATLSYIEPEYTSFCSNNLGALLGRSEVAPPTTCVFVDGNTLETVPPITASVGAGYDAQLSGNWNWFVRGDFQYQEAMYGEEFNFSKSTPAELFNAAVGVENGTINVELFCRNCTDNDATYRLSRSSNYSAGATASTNQDLSIQPRKPAQVGLRASYSF